MFKEKKYSKLIFFSEFLNKVERVGNFEKKIVSPIYGNRLLLLDF